MAAAEQLITENLAIWTSAVQTKVAAGRGKAKKLELYGIKKLRELILQLAVRGLLVPQNPNDKPISSGELARRKPPKKQPTGRTGADLGPVTSDETGISIPSSWLWGRLYQVCKPEAPIVYGILQPGPDIRPDGVPYIRPTEIRSSQIELRDIRHTSPEIAEKYSRSSISAGDIIFTIVGTLGATAVVPDELENGNITQSSCRLRSDCTLVLPDFLVSVLGSPLTTSQIDRFKLGTAVKRLNIAHVRALAIPLPPLAEQARIIAKVDELMALCDQLEHQQEASITAHQTLVQTLLDALTTASERDGFTAAWARIADHFDALFTTEWSIDQLKQTILQLAVMGKLVPQDPNDEPASELLKKIAAEKAQLVQEKKICKPKKLQPIKVEERPFELPSTWEWLRFAELADEVGTGPFGTMVHKIDYVDAGVPLVNPSHMIDGQIVEESAVSVNEEKAKELSSYRLSEGDIVMARRGEMGRCAVVTAREKGWLCGTGSFVLRFNEKLCREFILLVFSTRFAKTYLGGESVGATMTNLNHGILNKMPFCLPPIAEQRRIIGKVDELMALCDTMKSEIRRAQITQLSLADAMTVPGLEQSRV